MAKATEYEEDGRKYQVGEILETDQGNMVVHAVSYQDKPDGSGDRHQFAYTLRHEDDIKAEEKANAAADKAARESQAAAEAQE